MQYLRTGADLNGQKDRSSSPVNSDRALKEAAENFKIPLSARLIYYLLMMALMEEEGLLDGFVIEAYNPGIQCSVTSFRNESNARIVELVMKQETWLERFCTASRLYGRVDVADDTVSMVLRMLHGLRT